MPVGKKRTFGQWLCHFGWHKFSLFAIGLVAPTGAYVKCQRCGAERYQSWI